MKRKFVSALCLAAVLLAAVLVPATALADDDKPTIAVLTLSAQSLRGRTIVGLLDTLAYHGYVDSAEIADFALNEDFEGEHLDIIWRDAGFDLPTVNIMVEEALDRGADILVTLTTNVTLTAVKASLESGIEPPPLVIFAIVTAPYSAGVAEAPCVKPSNVVGSHARVSYEEMVGLAPLLDPDVDLIGSFATPARSATVIGVERIKGYAAELGIDVETASWVTAGDGIVGAETLIDKGVDMFVSIGYPESLPAIVEIANVSGIPIVTSTMSYLPTGAHVVSGFYSYYQEGQIIGRMLVAELQGVLEPERTAIHADTAVTIALNLDSIAAGGIEIPAELMERADFVFENGESSEEFVKPEYADLNAEERHEELAGFLDTLHCTDEMIEEQRAALEAEE
ncbi:MAG: ABC transporter substrate binding protein [Chloroflexi bacterium]|nr:ABC transporter substrate binding protein [Chloroflexota bacterium]